MAKQVNATGSENGPLNPMADQAFDDFLIFDGRSGGTMDRS